VSALHDIVPLIAGSDGNHSGFWWFPFGVLWLVVLGTAIWLVVRALRRGERSGVAGAKEILAERYARGELTREEYREHLDELSRQE
jgi:putative membrane protein